MHPRTLASLLERNVVFPKYKASPMDLKDDRRILEVSTLIRKERDPAKLAKLAEEPSRLLDEKPFTPEDEDLPPTKGTKSP
jgi:hypothetical protein